MRKPKRVMGVVILAILSACAREAAPPGVEAVLPAKVTLQNCTTSPLSSGKYSFLGCTVIDATVPLPTPSPTASPTPTPTPTATPIPSPTPTATPTPTPTPTPPSGVLQGFGAGTPGGTGKPIYLVTNLNDSGAGSFRDALSQSNRYIKFSVGGTINSSANYNVQGKSYITIDGTSAPAPGITITGGAGLLFENGSHNIIVKNIRVQNSTDDNVAVFASHDIVFDHVTSYSDADGSLDITEGSYNVTVQYSLLYKTRGSGSMLVKYNTNRVTIHHSILAGVERNPLASGADGVTTSAQTVADVRNNIVWNWGWADGTQYGVGVGVDHGATVNIVNNFFQANGTYPNLKNLAIDLNHNGSGAKAYTAGNVSGNAVSLNTYGNVSTAFTAPAVTTETACIAAAKVLQQAGARPLNATDQAFVSSISLVNCP